MNPRRPLLHRVALPLALAAASAATAQTLTFSDGRTASLPDVKVVGDTVRLPLTLVGGGSGEISLPISGIVRLDWPEPGELKEAQTLLVARRDAEALALLDKSLPAHAPFKEIAGSWWARLAELRVRALARLGRDIDAEVALEMLRRSKTGAAHVPGATLDIASALIDAGKFAQARKKLEALVLPGDDETSAARADLLHARLLLADNKAEDALLSFLRVRTLHPRVLELQPAALLGAISCYEKLGYTERAKTARSRLLERYADSPEAAQARR